MGTKIKFSRQLLSEIKNVIKIRLLVLETKYVDRRADMLFIIRSFCLPVAYTIIIIITLIPACIIVCVTVLNLFWPKEIANEITKYTCNVRCKFRVPEEYVGSLKKAFRFVAPLK
jgi:hypothetical protein